MMVLADLDDILIRASYHTEMRSSSISEVRMDIAVPEYTSLAQALEVEQCQCPPGYRGLSCQVGTMQLCSVTNWMNRSEGLLPRWSDDDDSITQSRHVFVVSVFCRTALLDTLAQEEACILATVSRVTVTATRTPVTQRLASARYEALPAVF